MTNRLDEIRARWAGVVPDEWARSMHQEGGYLILSARRAVCPGADIVVEAMRLAVKNAPADVALLLTELDCAETFIAGLGGREALDRWRAIQAERWARHAEREGGGR